MTKLVPAPFYRSAHLSDLFASLDFLSEDLWGKRWFFLGLASVCFIITIFSNVDQTFSTISTGFTRGVLTTFTILSGLGSVTSCCSAFLVIRSLNSDVALLTLAFVALVTFAQLSYPLSELCVGGLGVGQISLQLVLLVLHLSNQSLKFLDAHLIQ